MRLRKYSDVCLILFVAVLLIVPAVFTNLEPNQISETENRKLADPLPIYVGYTDFMKSLNECANDRIGFREEMVGFYSDITVSWLQMRNKHVVFGKDGWLFLPNDLSDYTGENNNPEQIERCAQILKAMDEWCKERNCQFVFMVGPNKSSVYAEYMPDYIKQAEESFLDALTKRMERESVLFINPKDRLLEDADRVESYYKLDSHWNEYGAKYALDEMLEAIDLKEKDIKSTEHREEAGDLFMALAVESIGSDSLVVDVEANEACEIEEIPNTKHKVLKWADGSSFICYRDSFSEALENYYTHYFTGPMYWGWSANDFPEENLPEYIIVECVERSVGGVIEECNKVMNRP